MTRYFVRRAVFSSFESFKCVAPYGRPLWHSKGGLESPITKAAKMKGVLERKQDSRSSSRGMCVCATKIRHMVIWPDLLE
jgi:hypothetical protein